MVDININEERFQRKFNVTLEILAKKRSKLKDFSKKDFISETEKTLVEKVGINPEEKLKKMSDDEIAPLLHQVFQQVKTKFIDPTKLKRRKSEPTAPGTQDG